MKFKKAIVIFVGGIMTAVFTGALTQWVVCALQTAGYICKGEQHESIFSVGFGGDCIGGDYRMGIGFFVGRVYQI